MSDNIDLRVVKTRAALSAALLELLNKHSFDEIKVVDICQRAMVHRTTFYKHFEDKNHLLNYVINEIINGLMESIKPLSEYKTPEEFYSSLLKAVIEYIHSREKEFRLIIKNNTSGMFMLTMQSIISAHILEHLKMFANEGYSFNAPMAMIARYRSGGLISVACYLLESDDLYNTEEILNNMINLFFTPKCHM